MNVPELVAPLRDGRSVTIRRFALDDVPALGAFLREMPERDLLFFRQDIHRDDVLRSWAVEMLDPTTVGTVAIAQDGSLAGFAYVQRRDAPWNRHVGDVVAIVGPALRGQGLGTLLLQRALLFGESLGIEKVTARIVVEDRESVRVFEKLGFRHEGLLVDHAKASDGTRYDLALMGLKLANARAALSQNAPVDFTRRSS